MFFKLILENENGDRIDMTTTANQYMTSKIEGLNPPAGTVSTSSYAGMNGSYLNNAFIEKRNIVIHFEMRGVNVERRRHLLYKVVKPSRYIKIYYSTANIDVYAEGYVETCEVNNFEELTNGQISILCPDIYWYSVKSEMVLYSQIITSLGTFAFNYCNNLKSASLPNSLTKIGRNTFAALATDICGLTKISIPNNVTEICQYAFANTQIKSLTIPHTVTSVENYVCYSCTNLETVRYEGAVIGAFMFSGCTALKNFTIAVTCKEIADNCFCGCNLLTSVNYEGSLKDWAAIEKQQNWDSSANLTKIQCLDGYLEYGKETNEWNEVKENA